MRLIKYRAAASRSVLKARGDFTFWSQDGSALAVTGLRAGHLSSIPGTDKTLFCSSPRSDLLCVTHFASCEVDTEGFSPVGRAVAALS